MDETETRYICGRSDGTWTCQLCSGSYAHRHEGEHCPVVCRRGHSSCEAMRADELLEYEEVDV